MNKIEDTRGIIARIKNKMPHNAALRMSPFCEEVIALRLSGISFMRITQFLMMKGREFELSEATLARTLTKALTAVGMKKGDYLPLATDMQEKLGGRFVVDVYSKLSSLLFIQRRRLDALLRYEEEQRSAGKLNYVDSRINKITEVMGDLLEKLNGLGEVGAVAKETSRDVEVDPALEDLLIQNILEGKIVMFNKNQKVG